MNDNDKGEFFAILSTVYDYHGKPLSDSVARLWWHKLKDRMSMQTFRAAMDRNLETSEFLPKISSLLEAVNPHPAPEEAWNMLPKSEYEGGWVTNEMMQGWGACSNSLERGDMIGARVAFIERYKQAIAGKTEPPVWWVTRPIGMREPEKIDFEEKMVLTAPRGVPAGLIEAMKRQIPARIGADNPVTQALTEGGGLRRLEKQ